MGARVRGCEGARVQVLRTSAPSRTRTFAPSHLRTLAPLTAFLLIVAPGSAAQRASLTAAPQLAAVYDAIFDAQFTAVPDLLAKTCPPAPVEVCGLLDAVATWWRIQLDPHNRSHDAAFQLRIHPAIAAIEE